MFHYFLEAGLFSNERQKGGGSRWEERQREMWRSRGMYYMTKKYPFSITENKIIKYKFIKRKENVHDKDPTCLLSKILFYFVLFYFCFLSFLVPSSGLLL